MFRCFGFFEGAWLAENSRAISWCVRTSLGFNSDSIYFIKYGTSWSNMDVRTTILSGRMFLAGGLMALSFSVYATVVFSIFNITEVIASSLVAIWGMCLLIKSNKMEDSFSETDCDEESGRISPFYYELEPVVFKRELPPIPKDIGREYDPIILDKV